MHRAIIVALFVGLISNFGLQIPAAEASRSIIERVQEQKEKAQEAQKIVDEYGHGVLGFRVLGGDSIIYASFITRVLDDQNLRDTFIRIRNADIEILITHWNHPPCYISNDGDIIIHTGILNEAIIAYLNDGKECD